MSVYYNKKLISGVRDVPQMTLAEYNALTNKPDLWLRTDAPESDRGISASDVEYSTGVSVKDKIDELTVKYKDLQNGSDYSTFVDSKWHAYAQQTGNIVVISLSLRLKNYTTTGSGWSELFTLPSEISAPSLSLTQNVVTQEGQGIMINIESNRKISIQNTRTITQSILATQITFII